MKESRETKSRDRKRGERFLLEWLETQGYWVVCVCFGLVWFLLIFLMNEFMASDPVRQTPTLH
jgi:predicted metal-binding membrane protein